MASSGQPINTNFSGGELSPKMKGRFDLAVHQNGLETCENWNLLLEGGVERKDGSLYVGNALAHDKKSRLIEIVFDRTEAYVLEISNAAGALYRFDGSGDPEQVDTVSTPWLEAELDDVDYTVYDDSIYLAHKNHPPVRIKRVAYNSWTLTNFDDANQLLNPEAESVPAANSGKQNATKLPYISAVDNVKELRHSGGVIISNPTIDISQPLITVTVHEVDLANPTDHSTEIALDATGTWRFQASDLGAIIKLSSPIGYKGYYKITSYTSTILVGVKLLTTSLTDPVANGSTTVDRWCAWHTGRSSYPRTVCVFEDRLVFAGINSPQFEPQKNMSVFGSKPGDFFNFDTGIPFVDLTASSSYEFRLAGRNGGGKIQWIRDARVLLVGADLGEHRVAPGVSATSVDAKRQTFYGSAGPYAVEANNSIHFLSRDGKTVRRLQFNDTIDNYFADNMNLVASHILEGGAVSPTFQLHPNSVLWFVRSDGQLCGVSTIPEADINGWQRYNPGTDSYESAAVIPSFDGKADRLWVSVKRTIDGNTKRYIEVLDPTLNTDSVKKYTAVGSNILTGLGHLEGRVVDILADGIYVGQKTVVSGQVDAGRTVTDGEVGLHYDSEAKLMPFPTKPLSSKRRAEIQLRIHESQAGLTVNDENIILFEGGDPMDSTPPVFSGLKKVPNLGWTKDAPEVFKQTRPYDATILALAGKINIGD